MLDVVVVKADKDIVTKYANEIIDRCNEVLPAVNISKRSLRDTAGEKHTISCRKLLFLLGDDRNGAAETIGSWVTVVFPRLKDAKVLVVATNESGGEEEIKVFSSKTQKTTILKTLVVKTLKDVFQWWPNVLDFIYQWKPTGLKVFLNTDVEMKQQDTETESLDVEQGKLKQDISDLLQYNMADQTDKDESLVRCKLVIVVFGRDISVSDSLYRSLRLAKMNGSKVVFFFPHNERTFDRKIKRISTKRYMILEHMEGILFIVRNTAMKRYKLPPTRKPLIPTGPLSISNSYNAATGKTAMKVDWFPYPYGLGETISIQVRRSVQGIGNVWTELAADIPATRNAIALQADGKLPIWMTNYRIMSEDKDGNLSRGIKANIVSTADGRLRSQTQSGFAVYKPDQNPAHIRCPFCYTEVDTVPTEKSRCFPCCWCKDVAHSCPSCEKEVRRYNGFQ